MKNVIFLIDNAFNLDPRVVREAVLLKNAGYKLIVFALKEKEYSFFEHFEGICVYRIFDHRIFDFKKRAYHKRIAKKISLFSPQIVHCHDQTMLNIAAIIKKELPSVTLIYDSHELFKYWPINYSSNAGLWLKIKSWLVRKYEVYREQRNSKFVDYLITVNQSIANILKKEFSPKTKPAVIRNIPEMNGTKTGQTLEINGTIKIAYIAAGVYPKSLNLEQALIQLGSEKNIEVHLFGGYKGDPEFFKNLVKTKELNVIFHGKIMPEKITDALQTCHIGLVTTWNKKDVSYWLALDNKLFHYIQAGLPILSTAQPEYVEIVEKYNVGVCINPETSTFIEGLNKIIKNYTHYKNSVFNAASQLNWENESQILLNFYNDISSTS